MALRKDEFYYDPHEKKPMDKTQSAKRQRITINITPELYNRIKFEAYQHDQSLSEYIGEVLYQTLPNQISTIQQVHPLTPEILQNILAARQQILYNTNEQLFEDSTELIRQMREERDKELEQR